MRGLRSAQDSYIKNVRVTSAVRGKSVRTRGLREGCLRDQKSPWMVVKSLQFFPNEVWMMWHSNIVGFGLPFVPDKGDKPTNHRPFIGGGGGRPLVADPRQKCTATQRRGRNRQKGEVVPNKAGKQEAGMKRARTYVHPRFLYVYWPTKPRRTPYSYYHLFGLCYASIWRWFHTPHWSVCYLIHDVNYICLSNVFLKIKCIKNANKYTVLYGVSTNAAHGLVI